MNDKQSKQKANIIITYVSYNEKSTRLSIAYSDNKILLYNLIKEKYVDSYFFKNTSRFCLLITF